MEMKKPYNMLTLSGVRKALIDIAYYVSHMEDTEIKYLFQELHENLDAIQKARIGDKNFPNLWKQAVETYHGAERYGIEKWMGVLKE